MCKLEKYPEVVHGSEAILRSNLSTLKHKSRFHYLVGRGKYNLKDYRGALNAFKNKAWNCLLKEYAMRIISLSLIAIGHERQGVHWAREGRNLLNQLDVTAEIHAELNYSYIISNWKNSNSERKKHVHVNN